MDLWWYIFGAIALARTIPWMVMEISDGASLLNQIFRVIFWGSFAVLYELTSLGLILSFLFAHIPGGLIWTIYDWCEGADDSFQKVGDELSMVGNTNWLVGVPAEDLAESNSLIVWEQSARPQV